MKGGNRRTVRRRLGTAFTCGTTSSAAGDQEGIDDETRQFLPEESADGMRHPKGKAGVASLLDSGESNPSRGPSRMRHAEGDSWRSIRDRECYSMTPEVARLLCKEAQPGGSLGIATETNKTRGSDLRPPSAVILMPVGDWPSIAAGGRKWRSKTARKQKRSFLRGLERRAAQTLLKV